MEHAAGALRSRDLKRVTVDATVQPKAITFPTDAKLLHAAIMGLSRLARRHGIRLRQSYRGHDAQNPRRVLISGQRRGVFGTIKRELRRRSAIEPIIGHLNAQANLGCRYLKGRVGDAANAILSAVGHNFRRILAWLRAFLVPHPDSPHRRHH